MRRTPLIWTAFAACLAIAFLAVSWISFKVVELDRNDAESRRRGQLEENVRLALWRMDSALAPIIAQENSRPYYTYTAPVFFPTAPNTKSAAQPVASPLLVHSSDLLQLHFHISHKGQITSPQVPDDKRIRTLVESTFVSAEQIDDSANRLKQLRAFVDARELLAVLPEAKAPPESELPPMQQAAGSAQNPGNPSQNGSNITNNGPLAFNNNGNASNSLNSTNSVANANDGAQAANQQGRQQYFTPSEQTARGELEYQRRAQIIQQQQGNWDNQGSNNRFDRNFISIPTAAKVHEGVIRPVWLADNLVLARRVQIDNYDHIQGCWVNWPATRAWLLNMVSDLVPGADLVPAGSEDRQSRLLAALPVRLVTTNVPLAAAPQSPVRLSLIIAWGSMILASLAAVALLGGVMSLSNRRAAFVSAVTHELRTPLTTLRMYTEMLEGGMVADPQQQRSYLSTLRGEANRLGHLVENVLGYSRLERKRSAGRVESMLLRDLLAPITPRLAERATQGGMNLITTVPDGIDKDRVLVDRVAVEQILFNLVDNACKYAASAADKTIGLTAAIAGKHLTLRVCDNGPGIARPHARKLFRPFSKSVHEAAATKTPGLGLGLALSRRLARDMNGDLSYEPQEHGACFLLSLPIEVSSSS